MKISISMTRTRTPRIEILMMCLTNTKRSHTVKRHNEELYEKIARLSPRLFSTRTRSFAFSGSPNVGNMMAMLNQHKEEHGFRV